MQVSWRDIGIAPLAEAEELFVHDEAQANALAPYLRRLGQKMVGWILKEATATLEQLWDDAPIPVDRGKGAPYWFPGHDTASAFLMWRIVSRYKTLEDMEAALWEAGSAKIDPVITSYIRVQSSRKERPVRRLLGGEVIETDEKERGPKVRRVQAVPFLYNAIMSPIYNILKTARRAVLGGRTAGRIEVALSLQTRYKHAVAGDLSNFDEHVSFETEMMAQRMVIKPCLEACVARGVIEPWYAKLVIAVDNRIQEMDILSPPVRMDEEARRYRRVGTQRSGEKLTSDKGTWISLTRGEWKLDALGIRGVVEALGDDVIIFSDDPTLPEKWAALDTHIGFEETVATTPSFLMRHIPGGYTFLGRMMMGSIQKEVSQEPIHPLISALGTQSRLQALQGVQESHPFSHVYADWMRTCPSDKLQLSYQTAEQVPTALLGRAVAWLTTNTYQQEAIDESLRELVGPELFDDLYLRKVTTFKGLKEGAYQFGLPEARRQIARRSYVTSTYGS
jgi:hypothetical protein